MRAALVALVALLAAGAASAQEPDELQPEACRAPLLEIERPGGFEPGTSTALLMAVENPNGPPVDNVRATVTTTAPAGWTAIPTQRELTLGPQNTSVTTLVVTAPNRGSGAGGGNVTVLVTFVCTNDDIQTSASSSLSLGVAILAFNAPWPLVLSAFAVLAAGVTVLGIRRFRRGVAINASSQEREVASGKSVKFTFVIENRRGKPQRLRLAPEGVPEGWTLHMALELVDLEPGEEKTLWAILKAPPQAPPGLDVTVTLHLEDERGARDLGSALLHARVATG
ncbi:MAG TPA: hypothetical protein VM370_08220 [Candidatus Thermoplasmatota archaeon]|nr:hypothetical protein [Candidatus Thermoplasmatota archaeon]